MSTTLDTTKSKELPPKLQISDIRLKKPPSFSAYKNQNVPCSDVIRRSIMQNRQKNSPNLQLPASSYGYRHSITNNIPTIKRS